MKLFISDNWTLSITPPTRNILANEHLHVVFPRSKHMGMIAYNDTVHILYLEYNSITEPYYDFKDRISDINVIFFNDQWLRFSIGLNFSIIVKIFESRDDFLLDKLSNSYSALYIEKSQSYPNSLR